VTDAGGQRLELDGVHIAWRDHGPADAPPLVLVHSLGLDSRMWAPQVETLSSDRRIVTLDLRGHGRSDAPAGPYTMERLALDVLAVADAAGIETFDLCGLSIGGQIGQWLALERPHRLRALVLADTAARIGNADAWADRIAAVEAGGMAAIVGIVLERCFAAGIEERAPQYVSYARETVLAMSPVGYVGCCAALAASDLRERVATIAVPTLVMAGSEDVTTPPADARRLHEAIAGSELVILEGSAHVSNLDAEVAFTAHLDAFLGRQA
jgi:3-oxoadipate enol-lactonase